MYTNTPIVGSDLTFICENLKLLDYCLLVASTDSEGQPDNRSPQTPVGVITDVTIKDQPSVLEKGQEDIFDVGDDTSQTTQENPG